MTNSKQIITNNKIVSLLCLYVFSILMFDYTILYKFFLIISTLFTFLAYKGKFFKLTHFSITYAILILYFSLNIFLGKSVNNEYSLNYLYTMILNLIISIVSIRLLDNNYNIEKIMKTFIFTSVIMCFYILIADIRNIFSGHLGEGVMKPIFGTSYSHNDVALSAAFSIMFLSYFNFNSKRKVLNNILKFSFTIFIILTGARKSLILAILGLFIYPYIFSNIEKNTYKKIFNITLGFLFTIILAIIIMKNSTLYNLIGYRFEGYISGILGEEYSESSAKTRQVMKNMAIRLFKEKPITGYGLNTFRTFNGSFGTWSHNNYLELGVSGGIIAIIIYYYFYVYAFFRLMKIKKTPLSGMFFTIMIYMLIHDYLSISYISRMAIIILCMIDAYIRNDKLNNDNVKN